jgi:hypothetical protein
VKLLGRKWLKYFKLAIQLSRIISNKFGTLPQLLGKADAVWRHVKEDDAAKPFHVLHMGSVSDDSMSIQLLSLNMCPAMPLFGLPLAKCLAI